MVEGRKESVHIGQVNRLNKTAKGTILVTFNPSLFPISFYFFSLTSISMIPSLFFVFPPPNPDSPFKCSPIIRAYLNAPLSMRHTIIHFLNDSSAAIPHPHPYLLQHLPAKPTR